MSPSFISLLSNLQGSAPCHSSIHYPGFTNSVPPLGGRTKQILNRNKPVHLTLEKLEDRLNPSQLTDFTAIVVQTVVLSGATTGATTVDFSGAVTASTPVDATGHFQLQTALANLGLIEAVATDGAGVTSNQMEADLTVVTLYNPGDQTNLAGDSVYIGVSASDANNNPLTFTSAGVPPNVGVTDGEPGIVSGTIPNNAAQATPYQASITAIDPLVHAGVMQTFNWTVNPPVVTLYSPGDQTNLAGDSPYVGVSALNSDGYALQFSADGLPSGVTISNYSGTLGIISGTIPNDAYSTTPYVVTITATDPSSGVSASITFNWMVNSPVVTLYSPGDQSNFSGDSPTVSLSAWASDGESLSFGATGLPAGLNIDVTTGVISGTILDTAAASSPQLVTITATDESAGVIGSVTFNWTVTATVVTVADPGAQTSFEGDSVNLPTTASDSSGHSLTFSAVGLPARLSIDGVSGAISGIIAKNTVASSPYLVTITATDKSAGVSSSQTIGWTVSPPVVTLSNPGVQSNFDGDSIDIPLTTNHTTGNSFAAYGLPTGLSIDSSTGDISGTISSGAEAGGPYSVTVTVSYGSFSATQNFKWIVQASGTTFIWAAQSPGNWSDAANWQLLDGTQPTEAPQPGDIVIFNGTSQQDSTDDISFGTSPLAKLVVDGYTGSITLANDLPVVTFIQTSGTIVTSGGSEEITGFYSMAGGTQKGGGTVTIDAGAIVNWVDGSWTQAGTLNIASDAEFEIAGAGVHTISGWTINNDGETDWTQGEIDSASTTLTNKVDGLFTVSSSSLWHLLNAGDTSSISNSGNFVSIGGTLQTPTIIEAPLNSTGTMGVQAGALSLKGGGTLSGTLAITPGTKFVLASGNFAFVNLAQPANQNQGDLAVEGDGAAQLTGVTVNVPENQLIELQNVDLSPGGTIVGPGTLFVANQLNWTGGTMEGPGITRIGSGGTLTMSRNGDKSIYQRTLEVDANATAALNQGNLTASKNTIIVNSGTFEIRGDTSNIVQQDTPATAALPNTPQFQNLGTFVKKDSTNGNRSTVAVDFMNYGGMVRVDSDILRFSGSFTQSNRQDVDPLTGAITPHTGTIQTTQLLARVEGSNMDITGGVVNGDGTLWVTPSVVGGPATLRWANADCDGSASIIVDGPTSTMTIHGNLTVLSPTFRIINYGTISWQSGQMVVNGTILNARGAFFVVSGDDVMRGPDGAKLLNNGVFRKSGGMPFPGPGTRLQIEFDNVTELPPPGGIPGQATLEIQQGFVTLSRRGTFSSSAVTIGDPNNPAAIAFNLSIAGEIIAQQTVTFAGTGVIALRGGTITMTDFATVTISNSLFLMDDDATIRGKGVFTNTNTMTITNGSVQGGATLQNTGFLNFRLNTPFRIDASTLLNSGTVDDRALFGGGGRAIRLSNGSQITNSGIFKMGDGTSVVEPPNPDDRGASSIFENNGWLARVDAGANLPTAQIGVKFRNTGTGLITSRMLVVGIVPMNQGSFIFDNFTLNQGTMIIESAMFEIVSFFQNSGTISLGMASDGSGGTLVLDSGSMINQATGQVRGVGRIEGSVTNQGTVYAGNPLSLDPNAPANAPVISACGTLVVQGDYTQTSTGMLRIIIQAEIPQAGVCRTYSGFLDVTGTATLDGGLTFTRWDFTPPFAILVGASFDFLQYCNLNGDFSSKTYVALPDPRTWNYNIVFGNITVQ